MKNQKINEEIEYSSVRIVGNNLPELNITPGIYATNKALDLADNLNLDLILVSESPVICKIDDYAKLKYLERKNKKKQTVTKQKEVRFSPTTAENDITTKTKQILKFLNAGHKVKAYVDVKGGRAQNLKGQGIELLEAVEGLVTAAGFKTETSTRVEGRKIYIILTK